MIFIAKNEKGEPTWKLTLEGKKTVTRRLKPLPVGKEFAVQPGRGKFAVCRARVVSCMNSFRHYQSYAHILGLQKYKELEAHKEGFNSWYSLVDWFNKRGQDIESMFRIEFERLN